MSIYRLMTALQRCIAAVVLQARLFAWAHAKRATSGLIRREWKRAFTCPSGTVAKGSSSAIELLDNAREQCNCLPYSTMTTHMRVTVQLCALNLNAIDACYTMLTSRAPSHSTQLSMIISARSCTGSTRCTRPFHSVSIHSYGAVTQYRLFACA